MEIVMQVVRTIRNLRAELGIPPGKAVECIVVPTSPEAREAAEEGAGTIRTLARG